MIKFRHLRCSFCGKKETEVSKLVAGPQAYICDGCVEIAKQIMDDSPGNNQPSKVQPSVWRKLLSRAQQIWRGGDAQRGGSFSVSELKS
jgi:ATP-dependent protease Clp ATPase subunit